MLILFILVYFFTSGKKKLSERRNVSNGLMTATTDKLFLLVIPWSLSFVKFRSSRSEVFCKKGVLRNLTKFTGKHLCQSLLFNKVAGLRHRCFAVNFLKFLRTAFLQRTPLVAASIFFFIIKLIVRAVSADLKGVSLPFLMQQPSEVFYKKYCC